MDHYCASFSSDRQHESSAFSIPALNAVKKEPYSSTSTFAENTNIKRESNDFSNFFSTGSNQEVATSCHNAPVSMDCLTQTTAENRQQDNRSTNIADIARLLRIPPDPQLWTVQNSTTWLKWLGKEHDIANLSDCMAFDGPQLCSLTDLELMFLTGSPENGSKVMVQLEVWKTAAKGDKQSKLPSLNPMMESKLPSTLSASLGDEINSKPLTNRRLPPPPIGWSTANNVSNVGMMTSVPNSAANQSTEQLYSNMINSFSQTANFNDLTHLLPHFNILTSNYNNSPSPQNQITERAKLNFDQMTYSYLAGGHQAFLQAGTNFSTDLFETNRIQQRQSMIRHGSVGTTSDVSDVSPTGALPGELTSVNLPVLSKRRSSKHPIHLWEFLKQLLIEGRDGIKWIDREQGVFKIYNSQQVAKYWGERKNRPAMNYDKLSRSIRQYYKKGIIRKTTQGKRLVYQFCPAYR